MKRFRTALVCAFLAGLGLPAFAQSVRIERGVATRKKFGFYWETRLEPAAPAIDVGAITSVTTSSSTDPDTILRFWGTVPNMCILHTRHEWKSVPSPTHTEYNVQSDRSHGCARVNVVYVRKGRPG
jgi:hypothetical protein